MAHRDAALDSIGDFLHCPEVPGDREDRAGHVFVGPAGRELDRALAAASLDRREIYITAAVLAATVFVAASSLGLDANLAGLIGFAAGFGLRAGAIGFGWTLPGFAKEL